MPLSKGVFKLITLSLFSVLAISLAIPLAVYPQHPKVVRIYSEIHVDVKVLRFIPPIYDFRRVPKYGEL